MIHHRWLPLTACTSVIVGHRSIGYFEIWIDGGNVRTLAVLSGEMETRLHSPTTRREPLSLLKIHDFIGEVVSLAWQWGFSGTRLVLCLNFGVVKKSYTENSNTQKALRSCYIPTSLWEGRSTGRKVTKRTCKPQVSKMVEVDDTQPLVLDIERSDISTRT